MHDSIRDFLVAAKKSTYAFQGDDASVTPSSQALANLNSGMVHYSIGTYISEPHSLLA